MNGLILDIGCATGNFIQWKKDRIIGIDKDFKSIKIAKTREFTVCQSDILENLCFKDESFSGVNCSNILEHINDPLMMMCEIRRILKPGGKTVVMVPDIIRYGLKFWTDYTHKTPFTKKSLKQVAKDAGFTNFSVKRYAFNYLKYLPWSRRKHIKILCDQIEKIIACFFSKDLILIALK